MPDAHTRTHSHVAVRCVVQHVEVNNSEIRKVEIIEFKHPQFVLKPNGALLL